MRSEKSKQQKLEYSRAYQKNHREYYRKRAKAYYWKNPIEINNKRRNRPSSLFSKLSQNAKSRGIPVYITVREFTDWYNKQIKVCYYCNIPIERMVVSDRKTRQARSLGVDRMDNEKGYSFDNVVLSCIKCNFIKSNLLTAQEMKEIGQKYLKPKWQSKELK